MVLDDDDQDSLDLSLRPPFQAKPLQNTVSPSVFLFPIRYPPSPSSSTSIHMVVDPSTLTTSTSTASLVYPNSNVGDPSRLSIIVHPNPNVGDPSRLTPPIIVHPNPNVAYHPVHPNPNVGDPSRLTPPVIVHPNPNVADHPVHSNLNVADPPVHPNPYVIDPPQHGRRRRRDPGRNEIIPAPYPWATNRRATVYSLEYLLCHRIFTISGAVECKKCKFAHQIEFDLETKFSEVAGFIRRNGRNMHDRAPKEWLTPLLPDCSFCGKVNCVKPIIEKKNEVNWLFLFLGQMLVYCTLNQLKYFCKYTRNHRTGAKDRLIYLTYLTLFDQLNRRITEA